VGKGLSFESSLSLPLPEGAVESNERSVAALLDWFVKEKHAGELVAARDRY
jgi:hypothetical protein